MIFSDPDNIKKFKVHLDTVRVTKKGGLKIKASDPSCPDEKPGYMTFTSKEIQRMIDAMNKT